MDYQVIKARNISMKGHVMAGNQQPQGQMVYQNGGGQQQLGGVYSQRF